MVSEWSPELLEWLRSKSKSVGFDLVGVAPARGLDSPEEQLDAARFAAWIEAGRAGEMEYLKRTDDRQNLLRSSVCVPMPWARSVVICAINYNGSEQRSIDPAAATSGWIARYAWSGQPGAVDDPGGQLLRPSDYHTDLLSRLETLASEFQASTGCTSRSYVDTGPLVERSLAARAGIGWIGKNTCVLNQGLGSWLLLGSIVTSLAVPRELTMEPAADRCGSCTRCIDACPTDALLAPREMDASRCIAYLTIEKKGSVPEELRPAMGRQVFGCDICQDVCPWNRHAPLASGGQVHSREQLINPELEWLADMGQEEFRRWFKGSPLERTRRNRLHRNVAIAMGNSGETRFLPQLEQWSREEDAVLAEAARWAMAQISAGEERSVTTRDEHSAVLDEQRSAAKNRVSSRSG